MKDYNRINISSYNKTAKEYNKNVKSFSILPELNVFLSKIKKKDKILDLGCGPGHHSDFFVENGFDVVGIDLSSEMIAIARNEVPQANFEIMDLLNIEFDPNSFDGVWASASLLHVQKSQIKKVLVSIKKILKPNGVFYLSLKSGDGEAVINDDRYGGVTKFYSFYNQDEVISLLNEVDFGDIEFNLVDKRQNYDTNPWIHVFCKKM